MTVPVAVLLAFAGWTLAIMSLTVGWYRLSRVVSGAASINSFEGDAARATGWYQRAHRAHANCLENLPLYAALVVAIVATGAVHPVLDALALVMMVARVGQTVTHIVFMQTRLAVSVRFTLFCTQVVCMVAIGTLVALA